MSNLNNSKLGKFLSSKGFYIALAICIVGAGTAAWVAIDSTMDSLSAEPQTEKKIEEPAARDTSSGSTADWGFSSLSGAEQAEKKVEDVKKEESSSSASSSEPPKQPASSEPAQDVFKKSKKSESSPESPTAPQAQQPLAYSLPVMSELFNPYSNGELVKNKTLGDWRTHDGIDLKAEKGTEVMACADGKISRIYDDALWGTCIEIEHSGGLTSVYCGLDRASISLEEGGEVKVKDVIAQVDKIPCEISLESHLHFGLKQDGKWVDPVTTMGLA